MGSDGRDGLFLLALVLGGLIVGFGVGWAAHRDAATAYWQQQLIEKNLGRWVCDPTTGERRFEVGQEKGRE